MDMKSKIHLDFFPHQVLSCLPLFCLTSWWISSLLANPSYTVLCIHRGIMIYIKPKIKEPKSHKFIIEVCTFCHAYMHLMETVKN